MSIISRLEQREKKLLKNIARLKRLAAKGHFDEAEEDRKWLESFIQGKYGLDIACGDMVTGDSIGVDVAHDVIGVDYITQGDELNFANNSEFDFVCSNYFDCFNSGLKCLQEWHRALKVGGIVAFICCNAKLYTDQLCGPMHNKKRLSCYTEETIKFYLERAGYSNISITKSKKMLRCYAERV